MSEHEASQFVSATGSSESTTELASFITKEIPPPAKNLSNSLNNLKSVERKHSPDVTSPIIDEYGFVNKFACSRETYLLFRERYRDRKEAMEKVWKPLVTIKTPHGVRSNVAFSQTTLARTSSPTSGVEFVFQPFSPTVKKAIRAGIPSQIRPMAWFYYSGGEALRNRHPSPTAFYESLLMQPKPSAFFLLTDRMKMDFRDILPTNQVVRRDYFSASNTMIHDIPDLGRVRIIPDQQKTTDFRIGASGSSPGYNSVPFMSRLYNVLGAFFMFRPSVEYCRSICTIASTLLLVMQDEERAFWTLSALFSNYGDAEQFNFSEPNDEVVFHDFRQDSVEQVSSPTPSVFSSKSSVSGASSAADFKYFPVAMFKDTATCGYAAIDGLKSILKQKKPALASNLEALDIPISLITTTWFQCLFIDVLPTEASMRVLDAFIGEGFKVLYRVALALFFLNETELTQKIKGASAKRESSGFLGGLFGRSSPPLTSPDDPRTASSPQVILNLVKFMPKKQVDADVLLDVAFNRIGSLSMSTIVAECQSAAKQEKPLQSIRRFSLTAETKLSMDTIRRVSIAK